MGYQSIFITLNKNVKLEEVKKIMESKEMAKIVELNFQDLIYIAKAKKDIEGELSKEFNEGDILIAIGGERHKIPNFFNEIKKIFPRKFNDYIYLEDVIESISEETYRNDFDNLFDVIEDIDRSEYEKVYKETYLKYINSITSIKDLEGLTKNVEQNKEQLYSEWKIKTYKNRIEQLVQELDVTLTETEIDIRLSMNERLEIIEDGEKKLRVHNKSDNGFQTIRYIEYMDFNDIFDFTLLETNKLNKDKFYNIVEKYINKASLMPLDKVYFIEKESDIEEIKKKYSDLEFNFKEQLGMCCNLDNGYIVIINLRAIYIESNHAFTKALFDTSDYNSLFNLVFWEVLIHSLREAITYNLVIEYEELPRGYDNINKTINFIIESMNNSIRKDDYMCLGNI